MRFRIVTPEKTILDEEVESVSLPTKTGEITVLPDHIPLVSPLRAGELRYKQNNEEKFFAVSGGFIEVRADNEVLVLADTAEFGHEIDLERAQKAREKAYEMMQESYRDEKTYADAVAKLEKQIARIKVARKHRTRTKANLESGTMPQ